MTYLSIIVLLKGQRKHLKKRKAHSREVIMFLEVKNSGLYPSADLSQVTLGTNFFFCKEGKSIAYLPHRGVVRMRCECLEKYFEGKR